MGNYYTTARKKEIYRWMEDNAPDYENPTSLVEGAVAHFSDLNEPKEWDEIWEWALQVCPFD